MVSGIGSSNYQVGSWHTSNNPITQATQELVNKAQNPGQAATAPAAVVVTPDGRVVNVESEKKGSFLGKVVKLAIGAAVIVTGLIVASKYKWVSSESKNFVSKYLGIAGEWLDKTIWTNRLGKWFGAVRDKVVEKTKEVTETVAETVENAKTKAKKTGRATGSKRKPKNR